jgi:hypothetical protein
MPRELKSQTQVLEELEVSHTDIVVEAEKDWLWVIEPDLAPAHQVKGGCQCEECKERAAKREVIKGIGFRFAFTPHHLPSGKESRWSHSCLRPTRFKKSKHKGGSDKPRETEKPDDDLAEAMQFFQS